MNTSVQEDSAAVQVKFGSSSSSSSSSSTGTRPSRVSTEDRTSGGGTATETTAGLDDRYQGGTVSIEVKDTMAREVVRQAMENSSDKRYANLNDFGR